MINKNIIISAFSLMLCSFAFGNEAVDFTYSKYNIEDVKRFDIVENCNTLSDCPDFAIDCAKDSQNGSLHCIYPEFACSGNSNCYMLNNKKDYNMFLNDDDKTIYTALDEKNNTKKIIAKSCETSITIDRDYNGTPDTCTTAKCSSNDECLSQKCVSGICQINKSSPTYHCKVSGIYYLCYVLLEEHCVNDNNCASFKCHESEYICVNEHSPIKNSGSDSSDDSSHLTTGLIIAGVVLVILIILLALCCLCTKSSKKNRNDKINKS